MLRVLTVPYEYLGRSWRRGCKVVIAHYFILPLRLTPPQPLLSLHTLPTGMTTFYFTFFSLLLLLQLLFLSF